MKVIVSEKVYEKVLNIFLKINLKYEIVSIDNLNIKKDERYINLSSEKNKNIKKFINTEGVVIYNYSNNFNKKTMRELFKIKRYKPYKSKIEIYSQSNCEIFKKLIKFNPNILFAKITFDHKGNLVRVNGISDDDITIEFLTRLKDVFLDV